MAILPLLIPKTVSSQTLELLGLQRDYCAHRICAELQELCLQDRQLLVSPGEYRALYCLMAKAHVTARAQELHWQCCRLVSVLLVLVNEFTLIEEQFV